MIEFRGPARALATRRPLAAACIVISAVLGLAGVLGCSPSKPAPAPVPMKLMPLGDSITEGWIFVPGGYRVNLWKQLVQTDGDNIDFVGSQNDGPDDLGDADHEGHVGWRIDELSDDTDRWLRTYQPDAVLLLIGTNDIFQNYELSGAADRLEDLVTRICADRPGVLLSVASITPVPGQDDAVDAYNTGIPAVVSRAASAGCAASFIDMFAVVPASDIDKSHPTRAGYDKMAAAWSPVVTTMYETFEARAAR